MTERKRGSLRRVATVQPITAAMLPPSRGSRWEEREREARRVQKERERPNARREGTLIVAVRGVCASTVVAVAEERPCLCELPPSKLLLLLCCFCCHAVVPLDIAASESPVTSSLLLNPLSLVLCLLIVAQPLFRPAWKEACATLQKLFSAFAYWVQVRTFIA
ncbi:uncharacterized protein [Arachis hypogaea]|uniref:uncharacterized protein isoform X6 n=1 Tax=Arachis hypogaea TaxID=3818 RepID=UPI000DEE0F70|nr:uncharacterized protein LOC112765212 isoform X6 [Arachis hypogaea]XP_025666907.1 uncharacterized protein LOC112765212 isoform X6 [Arachis hypogaea]